MTQKPFGRPYAELTDPEFAAELERAAEERQLAFDCAADKLGRAQRLEERRSALRWHANEMADQVDYEIARARATPPESATFRARETLRRIDRLLADLRYERRLAEIDEEWKRR